MWNSVNIIAGEMKIEGRGLLKVASPVTWDHGEVPTRCVSVGYVWVCDYAAAGIGVNVCGPHGPPGNTWMSMGLWNISSTTHWLQYSGELVISLTRSNTLEKGPELWPGQHNGADPDVRGVGEQPQEYECERADPNTGVWVVPLLIVTSYIWANCP